MSEEVQKEIKKEVEKKLEKINSDNIIQFSKGLLKKEERLKLFEASLKKKEEVIVNLEIDLNKKIKNFQKKQKKFLGCIDKIVEKEDDRLKKTVAILEGMRAQNAAELLSVQDVSLAVKLLGALDTKKISKIFNVMDKEISARLQKQYMTMKK